ncbi:hypothetical protein B0H19DRAFT_1058746 [Mycena capillaripes]|nr:hypothetical protein B0H19DRAFT_1058746 [Mycena capillaripes]
MSTESALVQDAPLPFSGAPVPEDANPPTDFILRSSDNVDFHVHKQISVAFVSVFFSGMFKFPTGPNAPTELERDGKVVLNMPESKEVLYRVLSVSYPARSRQHYTLTSADLDSVCAVHEAAHKYQFTRPCSGLSNAPSEPLIHLWIAGMPSSSLGI